LTKLANGKRKSGSGAPAGNKNAVGNKGGGRPTKFNPKYGPMLIEFMDIAPFRKELKSSSKGFGKSGSQNFEREEFMLLANKLPTLTRFAMKIGVHRTTLENWVNEGQERIDEEKPLTVKNAKKPKLFEFFQHFTHAQDLYKEFIVQNGLAGLSPSPFAIFVLKNTTDMRDKTETDITSGGKELGNIVLPATQAPWPAPTNEKPNGIDKMPE